ncbi:MAG: GNAT family N-acetyltransferase [Emcibacter sp.]|nr:GNAT family N-acetyltransferase [Emcibacter sp.]
MTSIETERFILRPFETGDLDFLDALHGDEMVMRYILGRVRSPAENIAYLNNLLTLEEDHGIGHRVVIRKEDNQPVGRCGLSFFYGMEVSEEISEEFGAGNSPEDGMKNGQMMSYVLDPNSLPSNMKTGTKAGTVVISRIFELGYTFLQSAWGKGYASEAAAAMRHDSLHRLKIPEIHSVIHQDNMGSIAVAEKIGGRRLGACRILGNPGWDYVSTL